MKTYLEYDMLLVNVFDRRYLILRLALRERRGLDTAVEHRAVRCKFGYIRKLLGVVCLGLSCGGRRRSGGV